MEDYRGFSKEHNITPYKLLKLIRSDQFSLDSWRLADGVEVYIFDVDGLEEKHTDFKILAKRYNTNTSIFWKLIRKERNIYKNVKYIRSEIIKINELNQIEYISVLEKHK